MQEEICKKYARTQQKREKRSKNAARTWETQNMQTSKTQEICKKYARTQQKHARNMQERSKYARNMQEIRNAANTQNTQNTQQERSKNVRNAARTQTSKTQEICKICKILGPRKICKICDLHISRIFLFPPIISVEEVQLILYEICVAHGLYLACGQRVVLVNN